jgi:hypothetical protein
LGRAERDLQLARREGIGHGKGCNAYPRVVDATISAATHLLIQHPSNQIKNELRQLLLQIRLNPYFTDLFEALPKPQESLHRPIYPSPYLDIKDNIEKNMAIISNILGTDLL